MSAEPQLTEEEIKAYEEQLSRITSVEIALQASASLLNVGGRKLGLAEGTEQERDLEQVRDAVDSVRALLPIVERRMSAEQARPLRDALSQLQMAYAQLVQAAGEPGASASGAATEPNAGVASGGSAGASMRPDRSAPATGGDSAPGQGQKDGSAPSSPAASDEQDRQRGPAESSGRLWVPGR